MNKYFIYALCVTSGILLGVFFCNFSYFIFEKAVRLQDLLGLIVTSIIGIYIATNVSRAFAKNTSEKEFLIKEIKGALKLVNELIGLVHGKSLPFTKTVNNFKTINEDLLLLERLIESSHCKGLKIKGVRDELISLRNVITKISPVDGNIPLVGDNYNIARVNVLKLKSLLYNLVFEVNRY